MFLRLLKIFIIESFILNLNFSHFHTTNENNTVGFTKCFYRNISHLSGFYVQTLCLKNNQILNITMTRVLY